ncbi:MAG: UUP1 family membrane protein [Pseudomonadota bacterium]
MNNKTQFSILLALLVSIGMGISMYKVWSLGFTFVPEKKVSVWTVESTIAFMADGGPVEVSINLADNNDEFIVVDSMTEQQGYTFEIQDIDGVQRGIWRAEEARGPQKIYTKSHIYSKNAHVTVPAENMQSLHARQIPKLLSDAQRELAHSLIAKHQKQFEFNGHKATAFNTHSETISTVSWILQQLNTPENNVYIASLLEDKEEFGGATGLACSLLYEIGIMSRPVKGFFLDSENVHRYISSYVEVQDGDHWVLFDPVDAVPLNASNFLLWQTGNESIFEVFGGHDSSIAFSSMATQIMANRAAIGAGLGQAKSMLVDFSIYGLPIEFQHTFQLLLLIPFGALVVAVMRNLVGIRTSGTFLPILIALTFIQTSLMVGIALFVLIVSLGLILRSYLSHLNLLLVPRISAVLVFVIIIYLALAVGSYKMGSDFGLMASYFPMIIIAWTIERMSILWEEEGPKEVCIQCGGTLLTASFVYVLITSQYIKHISYSFPELLLVVLAIILCIGSYTGYRLSELRRFAPLGKM